MTALAANTWWDGRVRDALMAEARDGATIQKSALAASVAVRRVIIMNRDVRAATNPADVDSIMKRATDYSADVTTAFDTALAVARAGQERERLTKAKELFGQYFAAIKDSAAVQKEILDLRAVQSQRGIEFGTKFDAMLALPAMKNLDQGSLERTLPLVRTLAHADTSFKQARLVYWAYIVRQEDELPARMSNNLAQAEKSLAQAQEIAADDGVKKAITELIGYVPHYRDIVDKSFEATARQAAIMKTRADPLRVELDNILDSTISDLSKNAASWRSRSPRKKRTAAGSASAPRSSWSGS
jgi:hypothetical protein